VSVPPQYRFIVRILSAFLRQDGGVDTLVEWDERNLGRLVVGNVSPSEVDEILHSGATQRRRLTGGRRTYRGATGAGRLLTVIVDVLGPNHVRPAIARELAR
jgi:hypothetical protein